MNKTYYSPEEFGRDVQTLLKEISKGTYDYLLPVPQGGVPLAMALSFGLGIPILDPRPQQQAFEENPLLNKILVVDDIVDSGATAQRYEKAGGFACLHAKKGAPVYWDYCCHPGTEDWIDYWWENAGTNSAITDSVVRQLEYIGEDANREGLKDTPKRVVMSWKTLYGGYDEDPKLHIVTFEEGHCDEIVLLKDVEFYSTCEHHMLPFYGKAHIAYIPNGKVIGVSKLARILEVFARRLQIQERIGDQVTGILMEELQPKAAACILEAQHFCMTSRGVQKQNSIMVTSSMKGAFLDKPAARAELLGLIRA